MAYNGREWHIEGNGIYIMQRLKIKNAIVDKFETLSEIPRYLKETPRTEPDGYMNTSTQDGRDNWFGHASYDQTLDLVKDGWQAGATQAQGIRQASTNLIPDYSRIERPGFRVSHGGGLPIVPRAIQGHPQCYRRPKEAQKAWQTLDLWIAVNALARVDGDQLITKGVGAVALIDSLETRRIRVKVTAFTIAKAKDELHMSSCVVKNYSERLQLHTISFPLAHPAYFRRLIFGCRERLPDIRNWFDYGRSYSFDEQYNLPASLLPKGAAILLPRHDYNDATEAYQDMLTRVPMDKVR